MQDIETLAKRNEGVWLQAEWRPRYPPKAFWLETGFISKPTLETSLTDEDSSTNESAPRTNLETRPKKMGPLLHDFFQFVNILGLELLADCATDFGLRNTQAEFSSVVTGLCLYAKAPWFLVLLL